MRWHDLRAEFERLVAPPEDGASVSFGKRIGDGTTEAVERITTSAAVRSIVRSIGDIEIALSKIDENTYGICDDCGETICPERLEALPATARCRRCAGARSKDQGARGKG